EVRNESNKRNDSSANKLIPSLIKTSSSFTPPVISQSDSSIIAAPLPALPLLLPSTPDPPSVPSVPLEKAPKCFFSLLRDVFNTNASIDQRLTLHKLEELVKEKLRSFSPYIGWSTEMVASAMNYLSGVLPPPHLVPLVDYKEKNQQWQWIGGGRDLDSDLVPLCEEWMKSKDEDPTSSLISFSQSIPPPAKCQTDWIVRPSSDDEKVLYRKQEAIRYHNPYKAFTYRVHGYESVVGPVKGCGIGAANGHNSSSPNKAREHSLLVSDRPPFVTLLSLVRDAAARLPNGEGTRADICELLKDSQYLLPTISDQQVNGIVSGALDRLHYEKDPCVKYDVNRKVWIYLHRNRTEAEFERLHEVQIAAAKAKRSMNKASRKTNCVNPTNALSQTGQLSIISKTTQQAIHQAVTNILNSEALKIPSKPISIDNSEKAVSSSSLESVNTKSVTQDLKTSLVNTTITEKEITFDSNSLSPFNGSSSTLSSGSLFLSLQGKNQIRCKSDVVNTSTNIPIIMNSSEVTKLLVNDCNAVKFIGKPRTIRQTKPAIKVQIPKTITLPIPITQNTLKPQQSVTTSVVTESIPTLISVTNPLHKSTNPLTPSTTTSSTQQSRPLTTKIISGTQLNKKEITFDSNSLSPFNGSSSTLSSGSLFLSLQGKNQIRCKSDVVNTSTNIPIISKKKTTTKLKETKLSETLKSIAIADNKQNIIVSNSQTLNISQPTVTLSVAPNAVNSSEVTKLLVNDCNAVKFIGKPRTIRQTKPAIKVQIPKTITLPIPITQNTLKPQQSVTTSVVTESIPTLISVTNPLHKSTNPLTPSTTTSSTQQSRPLTTKIISGTQLN
ncbi:unnamed protein product, partial [Sphagnum jensenii]